jgi:photosystem II stability/assembly factor-like uncharacterized protein
MSWTMVDYWYQDGGAMLVHPDSFNILITGGQAPATEDRAFYVSVSRCRGDTWTRSKLSGSLPGYCHALAVAPGARQDCFAGGEVDGRGAVYRSPDFGRTWTKTPDAPPDTVWSLAVDPRDARVVYAAAGEMFRSPDAGSTWARLDAGCGFSSVRVHPEFPDTVVAGGDSGVVISYDGGQNWAALDDGLEERQVAWLEFCRDGSWLVAATQGRSCFAWSFTTGLGGRPGSAARRAELEAWPNPCPGVLTVRRAGAGPALVRVFDVLGRRARQERFPGGATELRLDLGGLGAGVYRVEVESGGARRAIRVVRP